MCIRHELKLRVQGVYFDLDSIVQPFVVRSSHLYLRRLWLECTPHWLYRTCCFPVLSCCSMLRTAAFMKLLGSIVQLVQVQMLSPNPTNDLPQSEWPWLSIGDCGADAARPVRTTHRPVL